MGELQNNSKVDVKNALRSDNIQNHLIVNCFLLFEERLLLTLNSVKFYTGICHFSPICLIYFVNTIMNSL